MKLSLTLLPLAGLAAALPGSRSSTSKRSPGAFGVMSARSGSDIHLLPMNAANSSFWLGPESETSSYCPPAIKKMGACPPGKTTAFSSATSLDVTVPGGQEIYIDPYGALRFTAPHSAYIPPGSSTGPFTYTPGNPLGEFSYGDGFMACPVDSGAEKKWQVFAARQNATVPGGDVDACLGFDAMAVKSNSNSTAAWQYS